MKSMRPTLLIATCVVLVLGLTGCQQFGSGQPGPAPQLFDRLVGAFVTTQPVDLSLSDGRLYAEERPDWTPNVNIAYVFPELDGAVGGIALLKIGDNGVGDSVLYSGTSKDQTVNDIKMGFAVEDNGTNSSIAGTIYFKPRPGETLSWWVNPVHQDESGGIYLVAGQGTFDTALDVTTSMSTNLAETYTTTAGTQTTADTVTVTITFQSRLAPDRISVLELSGSTSVITRHEFDPGTLPYLLAPAIDTAYLVVEEYGRDIPDIVTRELVNHKDARLTVYVAREDGILVPHITTLAWQ